jgi:sugar phosphate isomerase/epimerase
MKFALQDKLTGLKNYAEIFEAAKSLGFDGVEITHFEGPLNKETSRSILNASHATGIQASAVCGGYTHWIGDFDKSNRLEAVQGIKTSLQYTAEIGAQGLIAPAAYGMFSRKLPPFISPRNEEGDRKALLDSLARIAEDAEKFNVTLFLEPLNRYEDHMLNTVSQAVSLVKEVGSDKIKVMADFFHMSIEEPNIEETIAMYHPYIGYYHLADSNRMEPGKGHTDFAGPLALLNKFQYKGFLSYECGLSGEARKSLMESITFLKNTQKIVHI